MHSSRVGTSTRAVGFLPRSPVLSRCSTGSAKAAVLPVPVAACPRTSCPASRCGIASRWIGVGSSSPRPLRAARSSSRSPRSAKVLASSAVVTGPFSCFGEGPRHGRTSMRTWLTDRLGLDLPLVSAPMAGAAGGRLAGAVSAAGALGTVGAGPGASPAWFAAQAEAARAAAGERPVGIGLLAWGLEQEAAQLDAVIACRPALVSVSYGDYPRFVPALRDAGILVATQVGTPDEALAAAASGVDLIVARGGEGGGHGRDDVATLPLLQLVLDAVDLPVLAAGGIANARGLAAVLAAGAVGAWVGTAFLACPEAETSQVA